MWRFAFRHSFLPRLTGFSLLLLFGGRRRGDLRPLCTVSEDQAPLRRDNINNGLLAARLLSSDRLWTLPFPFVFFLVFLQPSAMSDDEHHFESKADAGASKTFPQQAGTIRKNAYIVIKQRPCKVTDSQGIFSPPVWVYVQHNSCWRFVYSVFFFLLFVLA